jgi:hypothetical protein
MLIASHQALLPIANPLETFHSLRSLLTNSPQFSLGRPLPLFTVENGQFLSRSVPTVFLHYAFVPVFTEL